MKISSVFRYLRSLSAVLVMVYGANLKAQTGAGFGTISGIVLDASNGKPLDGVIVEIPSSRIGALSGIDGVWKIERVPVGKVLLRARRVGLDTATINYEIAEGNNGPVEIRLSNAGSVISPMVVSATLEVQRREENSATVDVIGGGELRLARASHPAQVMKRIPGVYVAQLTGEGHSMAIRQPISTKPMYLYLEDGVPTRATGFFNHNALYEVNLPQSGGVEVLKGPGTALYGSDAIGGVVNSLTRPAPLSPSGEISVEGGRFGFQRLLVSAGTTKGAHGIRADLNLTRTDGWRDAAPYDRMSGTLRWDYSFSGGVGVKTVITATSVDQVDVLAQNEEQFHNRDPINRSPLAFRAVEAIRWSSAIGKEGERQSWSITPFARKNVLELLPSWQLTYNPQVWDTRNTSIGVLGKYRRDFDFLDSRVIVGSDIDVSPGSFTADQAVVVASGTGGARVFESWTRGAKHYDYDVTFRQASPYLHTEFSPVSNVRVDAGLRHDMVEYDYTTNIAPTESGRFRVPVSQTRSYVRSSPKFGVTADIAKGLNLYGSWRTGFRAPSHSQLFQQNDATNTVDLKPVTVESAELGLRGEHAGKVVWSVTGYDMRVMNDIITFVTEANTRIATNAGSTLHRGIEGSIGLRIPFNFRLDVAAAVAEHKYLEWTPQAARPASGSSPAVERISYDGQSIEQAPGILTNVLLTWNPSFLRGGRIAGEWSHSGDYPMDPAGSANYPGHDILTLHANAYLMAGAEVFARVVNLADKKYAETSSYDRFQGQLLTPGTPRSVYLGLRWMWER